MKKLLIMASLFWPQKKSGGPPISILNLVKSIKDSFDIYIISKNHEIGEDKPLDGISEGWNEFDFGKAIYLSKEEHSPGNITRIIEEVNPDVIYQNSFFSGDDLLPVLFYKKRHKNVKVIVAPRGELYPERIKNGNFKKTVYGKLLKCAGLLKDIYFQGTGEDECRQENDFLGIPESHLLNIQNISVIASGDIQGINKIKGSLRLVYIARIHPMKNTLKAIEWLAQISGDIKYDIYGPIEDKEYGNKCLEAIKSLPSNIKVEFKGSIEHSDVPAVIAGYHAYYMPTSGENFGHSIVEAMAAGRPVLISDQTPWTDVNGHGGFAIPLNDENRFCEKLKELTDMEQNEYDALCGDIREYICGKLDVDNIIRDYIKAFGGEIDGQ